MTSLARRCRKSDVPLFLCGTSSIEARSQGGGGGAVGAVAPKKNARKKGGEREKKRKIKLRVCVKLPPFNHFQSKIKYKFVLYEENTGHMHQIPPLTTSKCKKLLLWEEGHPSPPPPRSLRSLGLGRFAPSHVIFTAPLKLNPGYATVSIHVTVNSLNPAASLRLIMSRPIMGQAAMSSSKVHVRQMGYTLNGLPDNLAGFI